MRVHFPPKSVEQFHSKHEPYFKFYHKQQTNNHKPTHLNNILNTTTKTKNIKHATQIHTQLITNSYLSSPFLFNSLLNLYSKCGCINRSKLLFVTAPDASKHVITWTSLITQLCHFNKHFEALTSFEQMRSTGIHPNAFTFSSVLTACTNTLIIFHGEQIQCLVFKQGFDADVFVNSALVDMYAKCGNMAMARRMFDEMPVRNLVSWNSMIVGCLQNKIYDMAIGFFIGAIREELLSPDQVSFSSVLSACTNVGRSEFGRQVHGLIVKHGLVTLPYVRNPLMDMYFKCGLFHDAAMLFRQIGDKDVVAWNIMISGCVHSYMFEEACGYFCLMRKESIPANEVSYSTILHASASLAVLNQGMLIHNQILKTGFEKNAHVATSLISMYAKCGSMFEASRVFEESKNRNVVFWTAMISAYQQHGCANQVMELFEEMLGVGIKPDYITFVCVLSACSHTGSIEEGYAYFNSMTKVHGISPGHEHYACMVDLLGRAGRLDDAKKFIETMPIKPDSTVLGALLGACANHGNLEMGREFAERLFELEPDNPGNYLLLSNMYSRIGRLREADEIRRFMGASGVRKEPGCSWIDVRNETFVFTVHDNSHSRTQEIYEMLGKLKDLVKKKGYVAEKEFAINCTEEYKEQNLWHHSERLALAFGLMTLPAGAPIRIKKNLRTCGDCHTVMKFASEIFEREIIVRDINRFHHFSNGLCSCRDYW
ncbi:hypothetical protein Ddye_029449 [Dipteronia dyeriana]|uniref:DYW domain-containing protein n=1 Tax=Dipteronia dyeriana TaxID=168575 RepID=A0AAD9TEL7_9ROSI|nr:hypothetical protein Ddye_029449 [Dipteronia dyeriana]